MFKILLSIFAFLILVNYNMQAKEGSWLNPGVKFGYAFGNGGGFVFGLELSMVWLNEDRFHGIVIAFERCDNAKLIKYHVAYETLPLINSPVGVSLGPSLTIIDDKKYPGFTSTLYGGVLIIPYLAFTFNLGTAPDFDLGSYIKLPIPMKKTDIFKQ